MEKYDQVYIQNLLNEISFNILQRNKNVAEERLLRLMSLKPACKVQVVNNTNFFISEQMRGYVDSLDSCVSLQVIQPSVSIPAPQNLSGLNTISQLTLSDTVSFVPAKSIDSFNKEVYDKLVKAGNNRDDARYAATGVSSFEEGVEKLKKKK